MIELLKGAWPTVLTLTTFWLLVAATETWRLPPAIASIVGILVFFGSFAHLIRIQFARRKNIKDVSASWLLAGALGFALLALALALASFVDKGSQVEPNQSLQRTPGGAAERQR